ncbi:hypothetical protein QUA81_04260 [Microcoleus sp. F6_B4]
MLQVAWKRNSGECQVDEAWFIITNLGSLPAAIPYGIASLHDACKQRMGIEEMFPDCQTGGYALERTSLKGNRLINIILLVTLAYSSAIFEGTELRKKQVEKYVFRPHKPKKIYRRRSTFGVGARWRKVG